MLHTETIETATNEEYYMNKQAQEIQTMLEMAKALMDRCVEDEDPEGLAGLHKRLTAALADSLGVTPRVLPYRLYTYKLEGSL